MKHAQVRERLLAYLDQELDPQEYQQVEQHLSNCPRCQQELRDYVETTRFVCQALSTFSCPQELSARIMQQVRQQRTITKARLFWQTYRRLAALLLLGLTVALGWLQFWYTPTPWQVQISYRRPLYTQQELDLLVQVYNRRTGQAAVGRGQLALLDARQQRHQLLAFKTDQQGCWHGRVPLPSLAAGPAYLRVEFQGPTFQEVLYQPVSLLAAPPPKSSSADQQLILNTDRQRYHPGQFIRVRTLALDRKGHPWRTVVRYQVADARGNTILDIQRSCSAYGLSWCTLPLGRMIVPGRYTITVSSQGVRASQVVTVTPPELAHCNIQVQAPVPLVGKRWPLVIKVHDGCGRPLAYAQVEVREQRHNRLLGRAGLDARGQVTLATTVPPHELDNLQLRIMVTDQRGQVATRHLSYPVAGARLVFRVAPCPGKDLPERCQRFLLGVFYRDGRPAVAKLRIAGRWYNTNHLGLVPLQAPVGKRLNIQAQTASGIQAQWQFLVPSFDQRKNRGLCWHPSRYWYRSDEDIKLPISSPYSGPVVVDIFHQDQLLRTETIFLQARQQTSLHLTPASWQAAHSLPLSGGLLCLKAYQCLPGKTRIIQSQCTILVAGPQLQIKLQPPSPSTTPGSQNQVLTWQPGQPLRLTYLVSEGQGQPTVAALSTQLTSPLRAPWQENTSALTPLQASLVPAPRPAYLTRLAAAVGNPDLANSLQVQALTFLLAARAGQLTSSLPKPPHQHIAATRPALTLRVFQDNYAAKQARIQAEKQAASWTLLCLGAGLLLFSSLLYLALQLGAYFTQAWQQGARGPSWSWRRSAWIGATVLLVGVLAGLYHTWEAPLAYHYKDQSASVTKHKAARPQANCKQLSGKIGGPQYERTRGLAYQHPSHSQAPVFSKPMASRASQLPALRPLSVRRAKTAPPALAVSQTKRHASLASPQANRVGSHRPVRSSRCRLSSSPAPDKIIASTRHLHADTKAAAKSQAVQSAAEHTGMPQPSASAGPQAEHRNWVPQLITDSQGRAGQELLLDETPPRLRLRVSAINQAGKRGYQEWPLQISRTFRACLKVPQRLLTHDTVGLRLCLHNYLAQPQAVRLRLIAQPWFRLEQTLPRQLSLPPNANRAVPFVIQVRQPGIHHLRLVVRSPKTRVSLQSQLTVLPAAKPVVQATTAKLRRCWQCELRPPRQQRAHHLGWTLKLYDSLASVLDEGAQGLQRWRWAGLEALCATIQVRILQWHYHVKQQLMSPSPHRPRSAYWQRAYQELLYHATPSGGFSRWPGGRAQVSLTAQAWYTLKLLRQVQDVDQGVLRRAQDWLRQQQQSAGHWPAYSPVAAYAAAASTAEVLGLLGPRGLTNTSRQQACLYLRRHAPQLHQPALMALVAWALLRQNPADQQGRRLLQRLISCCDLPQPAVWQDEYGPKAAAPRPRTLGLLVQALAITRKLGRFSQAVGQYLWRTRDPYGTWYTVRDTLAALQTLVLLAPDQQLAPNVAQVLVNNHAIRRLALNPRHSTVHRLELPAPLPGTAPYDLQVQLANPGNLVVQLVRTYYRPEPQSATPAALRWQLQQHYQRQHLTAGEATLVSLQLSYHGSQPAGLSVLQLPVPFGCELDLRSFKGWQSSGLLRYWRIGKHQAQVYLEGVLPGTTLRLHYRLQAGEPMAIRVPGVRLCEYDQPRHHFQAPTCQLVVRPR